MPSYFNRRTIGSFDSSRHRIPSGHHDIGGPVRFVPVVPSQQQGNRQQDQRQPFQPSVAPKTSMECGDDSIDGSIPHPLGHSFHNPTLLCSHCGHPFTSETDLDRHYLVCGAAALLTGMFTPWSAQYNHQRRQPQLHLHDAGGYHQVQYPNPNATKSAILDLP